MLIVNVLCGGISRFCPKMDSQMSAFNTLFLVYIYDKFYILNPPKLGEIQIGIIFVN